MITVFIPAKGNSERVKNKNLREIGGKSLILRTLDFAKGLERVSRIVLSTDSLEIVNQTFQNADLNAEFMAKPEDSIISTGSNVVIHKRSPDFSARDTKTTSLLDHYFRAQTHAESHLLLLQPTSPFRLASDRDYLNTLDLLSVDSLFSIAKAESPHPGKTFRWNPELPSTLTDLQIEQIQTPAQLLGNYFAPDGAFYLTRIGIFLTTRSLISKNSICYERTGFSTLNIDTEIDFEFAKFIASEMAKKP